MRTCCLTVLVVVFALSGVTGLFAEPGLTIYNQDFAVVRDTIRLDLKKGENFVDHTPRDELVRVYTGNAFDLVGERKRTDYHIDTSHDWLDESFELKVRNRKEEGTVEIRVVEHLYRWINWEITEKSHPFIKTDSQTMEFRVQLEPGEEKTITYTVHYTW